MKGVLKMKKINFKKLNMILASHNLEKELQYEVKGKINKNGDYVVKATWSIISKKLYTLLNLGGKMQAPEWFSSYMNKFENKLDKRFETMQNGIDKRFDRIENRLDNIENDIKLMKMTPTMNKELKIK